MSSLFHSWRNFDSALVKLPAVCVPGGEADTLRAKREAQLKWMRERGVRYLGNPMTRYASTLATTAAASTRTTIRCASSDTI